MTILLGLMAAFSISLFTTSGEETVDLSYQENAPCPITREFVATYEYLKKSSRHNYSDDQKKRVAREAASGCKDAAKRFVNIDGLLSRFDVPVTESVKRALKYAKADPERFEIFRQVFTDSFAEDRLKLTPKASYNVADSLAWATALEEETEEGVVSRAREIVRDFKKVAAFCLKDKKRGGLSMSSADCVKVAHEVAKAGGNRAEEWLKVYSFAVSKEGPALGIQSAIHVANTAVKEGAGAFDNFRYGYFYGRDKKGMNLGKADAAKFALGLTRQKFTEVAAGKGGLKGVGQKRTPASQKN